MPRETHPVRIMDNNEFDDIFDNHDASQVEDTAVEETTEQVVETTEEATETAPTTEQVKAPEHAPQHIPVAVAQAERQRRQEAENRAAEYERQLREFKAQQERATRPDAFENPDEYNDWVQQQIAEGVQNQIRTLQQQVVMSNLEQSHMHTLTKHGPEVTQNLMSWAEQRALESPQWEQVALAQPDPFGWMLEQYNRHAQYEEFVRDPEGFKARLLAEQSATAAASNPAYAANVAATNATTMAAKASAPRSLASVGSGTTSKPTAQTKAESFDAIFNSKG